MLQGLLARLIEILSVPGQPVWLLVLIPVLAFVTVLLVVMALTVPGETTVQERLRAYGYDLSRQPTGDLRQPFTNRVLLPFLRAIASLVNKLTPGSMVSGARVKLRQAGQPIDLTLFLFLRLAMTVLLPGLYLGPGLLAGKPLQAMDIGIGLLFLYIGNRLPDIWLSFKIDGRRDAITRALPDALDLIVVCVEAGYGLEAAVAKVVEATRGPLAQEFKQMLGEISVGRPRRDAMRDMAERAGSPDLQTFIAAILQADQMGVAIAEALRIQADAMRVRRRQRAEEQIAKAPVKMLFPLTAFIFPALLVVIAGPAFLKIFAMFASLQR